MARSPSEHWLKQNFPEYQTDTGYIRLNRSTGRFGRKVDTRETAPWKFWPGGVDQPQIGGYILRKNTGVTWPRYYKEWMPEKDRDLFWKSLNYFRNGFTDRGGQYQGKTMFGGPGLNPALLISNVVMPKVRGEVRQYRCEKGIYTPNSARYGTVAKFEFFDGTLWEGDHPIDYVATWTD